MFNLWDQIKGTVTALAGNWTAFVALGSFAVYALGYLVVRFHLTVFGIGTDLTVLDERYLFAGAKLLIYLLSTLPILILFGLIFLIIVQLSAIILQAAFWILHKLFPKRFRVNVASSSRVWRRVMFLCSHPRWIFKKIEVEILILIGIAFSVLLIQFAMRQCFLFHDLLLAPKPLQSPINDHWFMSVLLDKTGNSQYYYLSSLVIGTAFSLGLYLVAARRKRSRRARVLMRMLAGLVVVEFLFLPISYGILVFDKTVPKVESLGGHQDLVKCEEQYSNDCQEAWLVWEGAEGETYLVRDWKQHQEGRRLITLLRKDRKEIEITRFDHILSELFCLDGALK